MEERLLTGVIVLLIFACLANAQNEPKAFPVYKLVGPNGQSEDQSKNFSEILSQSNFTEKFFGRGVKPGEIEEIDGRYITRADSKSLEIYRSSGGIWYADNGQLWNFTAENVSLRDVNQSKKIADAFLSRELLPQNISTNASSNRTEATLYVTYLGTSGTRVASVDLKSNTTIVRQQDIQENYGLRVKGDSFDLPVVGGGGEINVVEGSRGSVIAYIGPRPGLAIKPIGIYPVIPRREADNLFREIECTGNAPIVYEADLAYYLPPNTQNQSYLIPVYVYRANIKVNNKSTPLRRIFISATTFHKTSFPDVVTIATRRLTPDPDKEAKRNPSRVPAAVKTSEISTLNSGNPNKMYKYGTVWRGVNLGQANNQGFADEMDAIGWTCLFKWRGDDAWKSDWVQNEDLVNEYKKIYGIDNADIVFYTGHADETGWILTDDQSSARINARLTSSEVQRRYGDNDAEWIIVAACGPLEDSTISCQNNLINATNNWGPIFNGLHGLLGYASATQESSEEGRLFARYMKEGNTVIKSWFRAAKEAQTGWTNPEQCPYGNGVYAAALVPRRGDVSAENDYLWGYGSVSPDIPNPDEFCLISSPC